MGMSSKKVSDNMEALIKLALDEDFGDGDVTSTYFVPEGLQARALMRPRTQGVLSGVKVAEAVFRAVDPSLKVEVYLILLMSISKNKGLSGFSSSHVWM